MALHLMNCLNIKTFENKNAAYSMFRMMLKMMEQCKVKNFITNNENRVMKLDKNSFYFKRQSEPNQNPMRLNNDDNKKKKKK